MRRPFYLMLFAAGALHAAAFAQQPSVRQLAVHAQAGVKKLECESTPPLRAPAQPNQDPLEIPTDEMIEAMAPEPLQETADERPHAYAAPLARLSQDGYRIAIWGDSHLAAGFFTEELVKLLKFPADRTPDVLLPANMGKAGVRLPLRRSCVSSQWKYEPGYLGGSNAAAPGPGLVNMFSDQAGSTLAWDIRKDAQSPRYGHVRILYQQTPTPMIVGISVDGDAEQEVTLEEKPGPAVLELVADRPLSQVKIRLIDARFRFHGLELLSGQPDPFELDVFGWPGATVAGWKTAQRDYFGTWFAQRSYQLVVLEFGTNEGNVKPFNLAGYRRTLTDSVRNMKAVFPGAACILIAPGDRGVLVRRSANIRRESGAPAPGRRRIAHGQKVDLFVYSKIHSEIGRVQAEVAADAGCIAWSMQDAMGGPGRSYQWARQAPALMAPDLIHFTVAGYQRLAREFARDMGWSAPSVRER